MTFLSDGGVVMKKIISLILVFVLFISFCGCSNMSVGMGNFEYNKLDFKRVFEL